MLTTRSSQPRESSRAEGDSSTNGYVLAGGLANKTLPGLLGALSYDDRKKSAGMVRRTSLKIPPMLIKVDNGPLLETESGGTSSALSPLKL